MDWTGRDISQTVTAPRAPGGAKNQSCRKLYIWVSKPIRRKIQNQWEKNKLNRTDQLGEKSKKPPENIVFIKVTFSGGFLDFSPNW